MFWLVEDHCPAAQGAPSRHAEGRLDLHLRLRGLQSGAHAKPDAQRSPGVVRPGRSVSERRCNASSELTSAKKHVSNARKLPSDSHRPRNYWLSTFFSAA